MCRVLKMANLPYATSYIELPSPNSRYCSCDVRPPKPTHGALPRCQLLITMTDRYTHTHTRARAGETTTSRTDLREGTSCNMYKQTFWKCPEKRPSLDGLVIHVDTRDTDYAQLNTEIEPNGALRGQRNVQSVLCLSFFLFFLRLSR